jgi:uncharacterized protein
MVTIAPFHARSTRAPRRLVATAWLVGVGLLTASQVATAQQARPNDEAGGSAVVTPLPEADTYRVQIFGDAFAEGLAPAIADVLANEQRLQINRKHRPIGALIRPEWEEDIKGEEASRETVHIAILMTGLFDKQAIKTSPTAKALAIGSDEWKDEYARRFERLVRAIKKRNTALYVIGQPILRNTTQSGQAEILSDLMRQRAAANGAKFIDIHEAFQDDSGGFSQFGPDISGNRVKLREGDGIMFTALGQRKLANLIERDLKRDVEQAASDRAIPLAGDEAEQKRLNPAKAAGGATIAGWKGSVVVGAKTATPSSIPLAPGGVEGGDQKVDNGRVTLRSVSATGREETVTIEIVRPAIPAAVIALLTRRDAGSDRGGQPGEGVVEDVGGGLTVVNSVSSLGESAGQQSGAKRKSPATQTAYYRVVVKGEYIAPKIGRADDFTWPRPEPVAATETPRTQPAQQTRPAAGPAPRPRS